MAGQVIFERNFKIKTGLEHAKSPEDSDSDIYHKMALDLGYKKPL
jgi:hypothetical protein